MDGEKKWRWLREFRRGARGKGMDLDCGRNMRGYMLDAGFVDVDARQFVVAVLEGSGYARDGGGLGVGDW